MLEKIKNNTSKENRYNIALMYKMLDHIENDINNGNASKFIFPYYKYDIKSNKYVTKIITFTFDYL